MHNCLHKIGKWMLGTGLGMGIFLLTFFPPVEGDRVSCFLVIMGEITSVLIIYLCLPMVIVGLLLWLTAGPGTR